MNILITGAGLIGSNAARHAVDNGHKAALFDLSPNRDYVDKIVGRDKAGIVAADMRDLPALLSALEKFNVDTIVHTAGLIGSRVQENSYTGATNNILGTINILEANPIGGHNLYATTKVCSEHLVHAYASMYDLDTIIIRPGGVFGRGFYIGGSTVGKVMRDLALAMIKGDPMMIDAKTYGPNEYVYGKDVGMALFLACIAQSPKQRVYNAGTGVVHGPQELAAVVRELAPRSEVKVSGTSAADKTRSIPMDISVSKTELGYAPKFMLKDALRDYVEDLWSEERR